MIKTKHTKTNDTNLAAPLVAALIIMFALLLVPTDARAQTVNLPDCNVLQSTISDYQIATNDMVIIIDSDCPISANLTILGNNNSKTLTIRSADPQNPVILTRGVSDNLFTVNSGAKLIFENIIIDGDKDNFQFPLNSGSLVDINYGGEFTMADGAVLRNNRASSSGGGVLSGGAFTMAGGEITGNTATSSGGGVYVGNGTFTMTGGKITGNTSFSGGGVSVSYGTFTMTGGEISGNTATNSSGINSGGGVYVNGGTFTMTGGEITGNTGANSGGGVYVSGTFTMTGGEISGNTATNSGGGVYVSYGTFTFGGSSVISNNTPDNVYLASGRQITLSTAVPPASGMNVGVRMATGYGVFVESGASETVASYFHSDDSDREIKHESGRLRIPGDNVFYDNVADYVFAADDMVIEVSQEDMALADAVIVLGNVNGKTLTIRSSDPQNPVVLTRGIFGNLFTVSSGAKLIFENIIIDGDKDTYSSNSGLLVRVEYGGEFTMADGAVLRNNQGSGVYVNQGGTFTMTGGKITGNSGGVNVGYGTFTMTGGEISGNTYSFGGGVYVGYGSTFTMTGGEITGNTGANSGGVYVGDYVTFTLGGTAVIIGNTSNDVYLASGSRYITLSTATPPASGMNVGIQMEDNGVFVESGASASISSFFHANELGSVIRHENGSLRILNIFTCLAEDICYGSSTADIIFNVSGNNNIVRPVIIQGNANGKTLTVRSADPQNPVILTSRVSGNMFTVNSGAKLIFENIIIDGGMDTSSSRGGSLVYVEAGGEFTMADGAVLRNNRNSSNVYPGGGVYVNGGTFKMTGGEIRDNTASFVGGVFINSNYNNPVGGVRVGGTFTMTGGKITGNDSTANGNGGGGVFVGGDCTFTMTGGEISGNTAYGAGGGVFIYGTFTMTGGEISGNTTYFGGGVMVYGTFTMIGGEINGNTASYSGGVDLSINSTFTMTGGKITGNIASDDNGVGGVSVGGGSYFCTFTMTGGEITGNIANRVGGVDVGGTFTLGGTAVISNNTPNNVYLESGGQITLSPEFPPVSGLNVGVRMAEVYGVFVESGASETVASYFHADEPGKVRVKHENGRLILDDNNFPGLGNYPSSRDDMIINVGGNLAIVDPVIIQGNANGKTITIRSPNPNNPVILTHGVSGNLFTVNSGAKLIFENIIIDGDKDNPALSDNTGSLVYVEDGGEFTMADGAVLRNSSGGGVSVGGTFTMTGGEISGNTSSGVSVNYNGTFTMTGGKISGNSASNGGGVRASGGTFTMTGGKISGNSASSGGGGVCGTFTMAGGEISGNTASFGGGVWVNGGTFIMNDGKISGNTASSYGGGVYVTYNGGTFIMNDGKITGNTANSGGGVSVDNNGTFTMVSGEITSNTASSYGGGVHVYGTFTLGGTAVITGNTPDNVYLASGRYITLSTAVPPAPGFNIGVQTETSSGLIVPGGCYALSAFHADESGKEVVCVGSDLVIATATPKVSITISPSTASVTVGASRVFTVTTQNTPDYTLSAPVAAGCAKSGNTVTCTPTAAGTYTVTVAATADTTKQAPAQLTANPYVPPVPTVTSVTVNPSTATVQAGTGYQFGATVAGTNSPSQSVTWSVSGNNNGGTSISASGLLSVAAGETASTLTVKATSTVDTGKSGTATVTVNSNQLLEESVIITGMRPEFQIGLARNNSTWAYEPSYPENGDVEFAVTGGDSPFMLWLGIQGVYPAVMLDNIAAGVTRDVSGLFYDVVVPYGVSGVEISFFEDVWYGDFNEGDVITLLKTDTEGVLAFERNGVYYEKTFVPDGSNPFPGEEPGVEPVVTVPSATVEKLSGGKERLTISITETLSDGSNVTGTLAVTINENTAGYYQVGQYLIYVDALGSGSIRRCYIVNRD